MNDLPRKKLREIILRYGAAVCDDSRRCAGLLRDFCGQNPREINVLIGALKKKIPADLISGETSHELLDRLVERMRSHMALAEDAARWSVESWALALGRMPHGERRSGALAESHTNAASDDPFESEPLLAAEEQLRMAVRAALIDGKIGFLEKGQLQGLRDRLGVGVEAAQRILAEEHKRKTGDPEICGCLGHKGDVTCVAFAPNGTRLLSASYDKTLRIWEWDALKAREIQQLSGSLGALQCAAYSLDGTQIAAAGDESLIRVWDAASGAARAPMEVPSHRLPIQCVGFSPGGRRLYSVSADNTILIYDLAHAHDAPELIPIMGKPPLIASISSSGKLMAAENCGRVRVWELAGGLRETKNFIAQRASITSAAFTRDGDLAACGGSDGSVIVWDLQTMRQLQRLEGHTDAISSLAFSTDGARLVTGSWDKSVRVWDTYAGKPLQKYLGHLSVIRSVAISPDGRYVATAGDGRVFRLWIVDPGEAR